MTGLVRKAALMSVCGLTVAGVALAGIPDATTSVLMITGGGVTNTVPVTVMRGNGLAPDPGSPGRNPFIPGGTSALVPGPTSRTVVVKDFAGNPISGALVKVSWAQCCDVVLCSNVSGQPSASTVINQGGPAGEQELHGFTNSQGEYTFIAVGAGQNNENGAPPAQDGCGVMLAGHNARLVRITADVGVGPPVAIEDAQSYVYNENGTVSNNSVSATDAGQCLADANCASLPGGFRKGRSDWSRSLSPFSPDADVTAGDAGCLLSEANNLNLPGNQNPAICIGGTLGTRSAVCP